MTVRLIRLAEVESIVGLKRSAIYSRIQQGCFPQPIKLGKRSSAWLLTEIDQWIADQIIQSRLATDDSEPKYKHEDRGSS